MKTVNLEENYELALKLYESLNNYYKKTFCQGTIDFDDFSERDPLEMQLSDLVSLAYVNMINAKINAKYIKSKSENTPDFCG